MWRTYRNFQDCILPPDGFYTVSISQKILKAEIKNKMIYIENFSETNKPVQMDFIA